MANDPQEADLAPCPKCGDIRALCLQLGQVFCGRCAFEAPIETWNTRADLPRATTDVATCDYRSDACAAEGSVVGGRWVCKKHLQQAGRVSDTLNDGGRPAVNPEHESVTSSTSEHSLRPTPRPTGETTVESALAELWDLIDLRCEITFQTGGWIVITVWANSIIPMELFRVRRPTLDDCMVEVREWASVRAASRTEGGGEKNNAKM